MRAWLLVFTVLAQSASADVQPLVDYALLLETHHAETNLIARNGSVDRWIDLGDGVTTKCRGSQGEDCISVNLASKGQDMGCRLLEIAATLRRFSRCAPEGDMAQEAEISSMFYLLVDHFAKNAVPPRRPEDLAGALLTPNAMEPSCSRLFSLFGPNVSKFQSNRAEITRYVSQAHLPVTVCGAEFPDLDDQQGSR